MVEESQASGSLLIVDDNAEFRTLLAGMIHRSFPAVGVGEAGSGQEALAQLGARRFDVMLLDYRLPDIDGIEVLGEIRKRLVDVAVVVITGEGDEQVAADLFRMGAYDYLVKGAVDAAQVRRCLEQVFLRRGLEGQILKKSDALVATSRELSERTRALDTAYDKLREKKEQLRLLSDSLEAQVRQRTAELESTTAFLQSVLDSTTDHFIIATGARGTVLTFNRGAEAAFGRPASDVVGSRHFRELFRELLEDDEALLALVHECRQQGSVSRELTGLGGGGRPFVARLTLSRIEGPERGEAGTMGLVLVGADVTHERELERQNEAYIRQIEMANLDLRRKNEQILEATRLKSEFLANVSHELRTPLNAIIGYSDLLLGGIYGPVAGRQGSAIEGIATRARDLLALINDILDLAKIESGRMDLRVDHFPLREVCEEVLETARVLASDKPVEVAWTVRDAAEADCRTDRQKLSQILLNLLNNAVKFTKKGFVHLEARHGGEGELRIAVVDSGIGIPPADCEAIFDEFRQVDGTSTREFGGTGLGLAISRKFAHRLGGDLTVQSALGQGSTFLLSVPSRLPGGEELEDGERITVTLVAGSPQG